MNNNIEDPALLELIKAFDLLDPPKKIEYEYRLYYNEEGIIYRTTNQKSDPIEDGNFVVVDESIHKNYVRYRIENGKPEPIPQHMGFVRPGLIRSEKGVAVVKNNASLPLTTEDEYENIEHYDYRSNRRS
jgi:hypothetical protein